MLNVPVGTEQLFCKHPLYSNNFAWLFATLVKTLKNLILK